LAARKFLSHWPVGHTTGAGTSMSKLSDCFVTNSFHKIRYIYMLCLCLFFLICFSCDTCMQCNFNSVSLKLPIHVQIDACNHHNISNSLWNKI
jgi:hypothetical protein